jgi:hypothetical protein
MILGIEAAMIEIRRKLGELQGEDYRADQAHEKAAQVMWNT